MGDDGDSFGFALILILGGIVLPALLVYHFYEDIIVGVLTITNAHLWVFQFWPDPLVCWEQTVDPRTGKAVYTLCFPGPPGSRAAATLSANQQYDPSMYTVGMVLTQVRFIGRYLRWPIGLGMVGFAGWIFYAWNVEYWYSRLFTGAKDQLQSYIAQAFPRMKVPADQNIAEQPVTEGNWARAILPIKLCVQYHLLINPDGEPYYPLQRYDEYNEQYDLPRDRFLPILNDHGFPQKAPEDFSRPVRLDEEATRTVFEDQMGDPFTGELTDLPDYRQALIGVFMEHGMGEIETAREHLNRLNDQFASRHPDADYPVRPNFDLGFTRDIFEEYRDHRKVRRHFENHGSYVRPLLMSLLEWTRKRGVMPWSEFNWIKLCDRTDSYTLNQVGRDRPFAEAAGPFAHYEAEQQLGRSIDHTEGPEITTAVHGLKNHLVKTGWLPESEHVEEAREGL